MVMYVAVVNQKTNNARRNGQPCQPMVAGSLRMITMGDMEMIYPDGLKLTFTDEGVIPDIVSLSQCCEVCNDPRMVNINGIKTCVACHSINHIDYGLNDRKPE